MKVSDNHLYNLDLDIAEQERKLRDEERKLREMKRKRARLRRKKKPYTENAEQMGGKVYSRR